MSTAIKTQAELTSVKQFNCPSCGAAHQVLNPRAKILACDYCGSVLDVKSEDYRILETLGKPSRHAPMSFIRVGQVANINGNDYQVLGRTRWRMKYKEYWSEEGESGYSNEVWVYDEWLLISQQRTYQYLVEDREGYWMSEEIIPETPTLTPNNLRMSFFKAQPRQIVREYGHQEVIYFEGESNYRIRQGDKAKFGTIIERGINYSVESRLDKNGEVKEIEFFKETPISRRKLLEAFSQNEEIDKIRVREGHWRNVFQVGALVFALLGLLTFYSITNDGTNVFTQSFNANQYSDSQPFVSDPIQISEPGLYKLSLDAQLQNMAEVYLVAYVLDKDKAAINSLDANFYYETGYEDGESWTEANTSEGKIFKLAQGDTYYIQVMRNGEDPILPTNVTIKVNKGIWLTRYFIIALIILGIGVMIAYANAGMGKTK
ncbi:MAG: hypothetical protein AAF206_09520 [Bacteroidota bacterium]